MVKYSVVIPTSLENFEYLEPCLESLRDHSDGKVEAVVVINGADQPKTIAMLKAFQPGDNLKIEAVRTPDRVGYSTACNMGIEYANGEYVVVSNDDVLFSPQWNTSFRECLNTFHKENPHLPPAAIVGPLSNNVAGQQLIKGPVTSEDYLDAAKVFRDTGELSRTSTSFLSGFCMMISRGFIEQMDGKPFDDRLVNGAEDNLICVNAMVKGWSLVVDVNTFIYHHGHRTTDRLPEEEDNARGCRNLLDFYRYGNELFGGEQLVAAGCRVRLLTKEHLRVFKLAVEKNASIADFLAVLNDRSVPELWEEALEYCFQAAEKYDIDFATHTNPERMHPDESRDRQWLLSTAREEVGDVNGWFLSFDADEVWEDKFTREELQRFIHPPHPGVFHYSFHFYTFWDEAETMCRKDGIFGSMCGPRLVRILPGYNILRNESGLHMGNIPLCTLAKSGVATSIRVKHYGFSTQEERQRKYDFYEEIDTVKDSQQIGASDYSHLISKDVMLGEWVEDTSLTIGTCVLNEEIALHTWLFLNWSFADEIIVCDTGSTDRTVELLKYWGVKVIDYETATGDKWDSTFAKGGDLAKARNLTLDETRTVWYWQIDADESPKPVKGQNPHSRIRKYLDRTDVEGINVIYESAHRGSSPSFSQTTRIFTKPQTRRYSGYVHETVDKSFSSGNEKMAYCNDVRFLNTGSLIGDEAYRKKATSYLRAGLRMIMDDPDRAVNWYSAGRQFLDSPLVPLQTLGLLLIQESLEREPNYGFAHKTLCVQSFIDLEQKLETLLNLVPEGHPYYDYCARGMEAIKIFGSGARSPVRYLDHLEEVLNEPQFSDFLELAKNYGYEKVMGSEEATQVQS